jgi:hypothetical protein
MTRRLEVGRQSGVLADALARYAERLRELRSFVDVHGHVEAKRSRAGGLNLDTCMLRS